MSGEQQSTTQVTPQYETFVARFPDLVVSCPAGKSDMLMTVGEFAQTERGPKYLGTIAVAFNELSEQSDMGDEKILTLVSAGAFARDDEDRIIGLPRQEAVSEPGQVAESKKK
ncbi:MAG TPA: hypothetical protein VK674_04820 [Candidatus Limnocylindria bacterium]|nr:hypothetical protein [Candidatus Limnocylindria bacterium]